MNKFHHSSYFPSIITDSSNIAEAYRKTRLGEGKYKTQASNYPCNYVDNNRRLIQELKDGSYRPGKYVEFKVYEPKERTIFAPQYRDKIVQHAINNVLAPYFKPYFISDSYACIVGKGNQRAVWRLQIFMRQARYYFGDTYYIVKADVAKFFYTINREVVKGILAKFIFCPWTLSLLFTIIDSSPGDIGLPLGNLTSQLLANILMNELDQFSKRTLGMKYYLRYADDVFGFLPSKCEARDRLGEITRFTEKRLGLKMHPLKSDVIKPTNGLDALGFKIFPDKILLTNDSKKRIKRKLNKVEGLLEEGHGVREIEQSLNGWLNFSNTGDNRDFIEHLLSKYSFLQLNRHNLFVIN